MADIFYFILRDLNLSIQGLYRFFESLLDLVFKDNRFHVNWVFSLLYPLHRGFDFLGYLFYEF